MGWILLALIALAPPIALIAFACSLPPDPAPSIGPGRRVLLLKLGLLFSGLLLVDGCFWFTANFKTFEPPSEGTLPERAWFTFAAASGPLYFLVKRLFWGFGPLLGEALFSLGFAACLIAPLLLAVRYRRYAVVRFLGYAAVLGWFVIGCGMTSLRIR